MATIKTLRAEDLKIGMQLQTDDGPVSILKVNVTVDRVDITIQGDVTVSCRPQKTMRASF